MRARQGRLCAVEHILGLISLMKFCFCQEYFNSHAQSFQERGFPIDFSEELATNSKSRSLCISRL